MLHLQTDTFRLFIYGLMESKPADRGRLLLILYSDNSELVIQHLLLGMNAHINLDFGIATSFVMKGFLLENIHNDFNTINSILASMIDNIEACLTKINPLMRLLNLNIYKYDEMLVQFSITTARDGAWSFAQELSGKTGNDYEIVFKQEINLFSNWEAVLPNLMDFC